MTAECQEIQRELQQLTENTIEVTPSHINRYIYIHVHVGGGDMHTYRPSIYIISDSHEHSV